MSVSKIWQAKRDLGMNAYKYNELVEIPCPMGLICGVARATVRTTIAPTPT